MTMGLTQRQEECFDFIVGYLDGKLKAPSLDEIQDFLGLRSKSGAHRIVKELEDRGLIRRLPNQARAIEVVEGRSPGFVVDPVPEVRRAIEAYAASHRITVKTAAEEALRAYFVEAA